MTDPSSSTTHSRLSTIGPSSLYTFSHVFLPETTQSDFFGKTTLPLVCDVLEGQSGLLFTYGVTNSGKTYTIQGGGSQGSAGILPRTLDVIFNSIEGLHGDSKVSYYVLLRNITLVDLILCVVQASTLARSRTRLRIRGADIHSSSQGRYSRTG